MCIRDRYGGHFIEMAEQDAPAKVFFGGLEVVSLPTSRYASKLASDDIRVMSKQLAEKGWCFVKLPPKLIPSPEFVDKVREFFSACKEKKQYHAPHDFGYASIKHKESLRYLTDWSSERKLDLVCPESLRENIKSFNSSLNEITCQLIIAMSKEVFGEEPNVVAKKSRYPRSMEIRISLWHVGHRILPQ
eukprot:TRINITY_DN477_c0_g1_i2.p1 TRINITY_DN477_c0_g1~~TRINITY_DN477_c0_g1_i2.p1  ORF type:complete len:189 (+),score=42.60 TRINITY_DN477_c0_g1_i2:1-567(+)